MADFTGENLPDSRFHDVDLTTARFHQVDLTGVVIRGAGLGKRRHQRRQRAA